MRPRSAGARRRQIRAILLIKALQFTKTGHKHQAGTAAAAMPFLHAAATRPSREHGVHFLLQRVRNPGPWLPGRARSLGPEYDQSTITPTVVLHVCRHGRIPACQSLHLEVKCVNLTLDFMSVFADQPATEIDTPASEETKCTRAGRKIY